MSSGHHHVGQYKRANQKESASGRDRLFRAHQSDGGWEKTVPVARGLGPDGP